MCAIRTVNDAVEFFNPDSNQLKKFCSQESSLEVLKWHMPAIDEDQTGTRNKKRDS